MPKIVAQNVRASAWDVTAANGFPLLALSSKGGKGGSAGKGLSGQLLELQPGATRPPVWTLNADAVAFVVYGVVTLSLYLGDEYTGSAPQRAEGIPPYPDEDRTGHLRLLPAAVSLLLPIAAAAC